MKRDKLHFSEIRYNPEFNAFEARATLHDAGIAYVYPVQVLAPLTADFDRIARLLSEKTHKMHARRRKHMHMHHPVCPTNDSDEHPRAA